MTEDEWLTCPTVTPLLRYLRVRHGVRAPGRRRLHLFACACCRHLEREGLVLGEPVREALRVAEGHADGRLPWPRLAHAHNQAAAGRGTAPEGTPLTELACALTLLDPGEAAFRAAGAAANVYVRMCRPDEAGEVASPRINAAFVRYLRDIFGNPFRTVRTDPAWLRWHDQTVPRLAQALYDEGTFERLPVLADALEEAGCTRAELLDHLRGPGPHARGCWVVDLLTDTGWRGG
jgi:hypothetical protein